MKRLILILMLLAAFITASAQEGLNIAKYFSQDFSKSGKVSSVTLSGNSAAKFGLDLYKSVTVVDNAIISSMEKAVKADGAKAYDKQTAFRKGRLHFGFYALKGKDCNRFIVFLNSGTDVDPKAMLIYMVGDATPEEVKKMMQKF